MISFEFRIHFPCTVTTAAKFRLIISQHVMSLISAGHKFNDYLNLQTVVTAHITTVSTNITSFVSLGVQEAHIE